MQTQVIAVESAATLQEFADSVARRHRHSVFPVLAANKPVGLISIWELAAIAPEDWPKTKVTEVARCEVVRVNESSDLEEALVLLARHEPEQMLLVTDADDALVGILTKADILRALDLRRRPLQPQSVQVAS